MRLLSSETRRRLTWERVFWRLSRTLTHSSPLLSLERTQPNNLNSIKSCWTWTVLRTSPSSEPMPSWGSLWLFARLALLTTAFLCTSMSLRKSHSYPLRHIANLAGYGDKSFVLPCPAFNVINGGSHAGNKLAMQEFMVWWLVVILADMSDPPCRCFLFRWGYAHGNWGLSQLEVRHFQEVRTRRLQRRWWGRFCPQHSRQQGRFGPPYPGHWEGYVTFQLDHLMPF